MSSIVSMQKKPVKKRGKSLWMKNVLTRTIILPFKSVGGNIIQIIKKKFGSKVAKIVSDCTDAEIEPKPPWLERKKSYIKSLKNKPQSSLFVSMCDKTHNASCIINDHKRVGKKLWKRFSAKPKQIYWYYDSLGKCFYKNLKGKKVLKHNFSKLVLELKKIS